MRYIAFLRAINVGGHVVKMDRLRTVFEAAGLENVETFIASGNVIFDSRARNAATLEKQIETALSKALGYEVTTFLRSPADVARAAEYEAFDAVADDDSLFVGFLKEKPASANTVVALSTPSDRFAVHDREVYWLRRKSSETVFSAARIEKALRMPMTMRNVTTVKKLAAKYR